jgi:tetratricopeptide (TPR) repeat protein/Cdc6-like AAA superfamily ATPase
MINPDENPQKQPPLSKQDFINLLDQFLEAEQAPDDWTYRVPAAMRVVFSVDELQSAGQPLDDAASQAIQRVISESRVVYGANGQPLWQLESQARRETFEHLGTPQALRQALEQNPAAQRGPLQEMLEVYIRAERPPLNELSLEQLEASLLVCDWLAGLLPDLPEPADLRRRLNRARLLKPFRFLAGEHFQGRSKELAALRLYVGVIDPANIPAEDHPDLPPDPSQPFLLFGPGGMGKSTLVAKFILQHAELDEAQRFPYAYIDFNRRDLDIRDPVSILLEATRQLSIQFPIDEDRWQKLAQEWRSSRQYMDRGFSKTAQFTKQSVDYRLAEWERYVSQFIYELGGLLQSGRPFLLVMDTFEELQYHRPEYLAGLWRFLLALKDGAQNLRVVISGRSDLPREFSLPAGNKILLKGLDEEAALALLLERGLPDRQAGQQVIELVGRSPLSLKLAADLYQRRLAEGGGEAAGIFDNLEARSQFFYAVKENLIQGQLYLRILGYIHDERVRALAHPGLVLRHITPELILNVLSAPLEIQIEGEADAHVLFEALAKEVTLVEPDQARPDELRQRPDLRLAMLELLRQDNPLQVEAIHRSALAYFSRHSQELQKQLSQAAESDQYELRRDLVICQADLAYHRLALGEDPVFLGEPEMGPLQQIADELGSTLQDLPVQAQLFFAARVKLDFTIDEQLKQKAELAEWESAAARRAASLLALGDNAAALQLLGERQDRSAGSPLYLLEAQARLGLGDPRQALFILGEGIRRTPPNTSAMLDLLLLSAATYEQDGRALSALATRRDALRTAGKLGDSLSQLQIQLDILRLEQAHREPAEPALLAELQTAGRAWSALTDLQLLDNPGVLQAALLQLGPLLPEVRQRTGRLLGLASDPPPDLATLAGLLAARGDLRTGEQRLQAAAKARSRLKEQFQALTGPHFVNREAEMAALRQYLGLEGNQPASPSPILIYGPGGIGKSALLAHLILQSVESEAGPAFPYAYLDFNRRDLDLRYPLSFLVEIANQLGVPLSSGQAANQPGEWDLYAADFAAVVQDLLVPDPNLQPKPLLLAFDAVEALQYQAPQTLAGLWHFIEKLGKAVPSLRVLLASRLPLPDEIGSQPQLHLLLEGFSVAAALAYLGAAGITDEQLARRVLASVGTTPLSLSLAVELLEVEGEAGLAELEKGLALPEEQTLAVLYQRILASLPDPRLRALLQGGVVLRRLTPELILKVLAGPLEIEVANPAEAQAIFEALTGEATLFEPFQSGPGELRLRPDLRHLLLDLQSRDQPDRVAAIHRAAREYYGARAAQTLEQAPQLKQSGEFGLRASYSADQTDWFYHRLALGEEPTFLDKFPRELLQQFADELGSDLQDLPLSAQTFLAARVQVDPALEEQLKKQAEQSTWEAETARSLTNLLALGEYDRALGLLAANQDRAPGSPLYLLEAQIYAGLGQLDQAQSVVERGLQSTSPNSQTRLDLLLLLADLEEQNGSLEQAIASQRLALETAKNLENQLSQLYIQVNILRLEAARLEYDDPLLQSERQEVLALWLGLDDSQLGGDPVLVRAVAGQLGTENQDVLRRAVRLVGLGSSKPPNLEALASTLASWDDQISAEQDAQPGLLAQQVKASWQTDLYGTWLDFLQQNPWDKISRAVQRLVEKTPLTLTVSITLLDLIKPRLVLNQRQASLLHSVIAGSFTPQELDELLRQNMDTGLAQLSSRTDRAGQVSDLVNWLQTTGRLLDLLQVVFSLRPNNPTLLRLLESLDIDYRPLLGLADTGQAQEYFEQAAAAAGAAGDTIGQAYALGQLADLLAGQGEYSQARELYAQQLSLAESSNDLEQAADTLGNLGHLLVYLGQLQPALRSYQQQLEYARQLADPARSGLALLNLGRTYLNQGDYPQAQDQFTQSLEYARQAGDQRLEVDILAGLGLANLRMGNLPQALQYFQQQQALAAELGDRQLEQVAIGNQGMVYLQQGDLEQGMVLFEQVIQYAEQSGDLRLRLDSAANLGLAFLNQGQPERALPYYESNVSYARQMDDPTLLVLALGDLGFNYTQASDSLRAIATLQEAANLAEGLPDPGVLENTLTNLGHAYFQSGDLDQAEAAYQRVYDMGRAGDNPLRTGLGQANLGAVYLRRGQRDQARAALTEALGILQSLNHSTASVVQDLLDSLDQNLDSDQILDALLIPQKTETRETSQTGEINLPPTLPITPDLAGLAQGVCRCELLQANGTPVYSTAFLVGPNLVLVAFPAVETLLDGSLPPQNVTFRFDLLATSANEILSQGQVYSLAVGTEAQARFRSERPWLLAADRDLYYAILRLARRAGDDPPGGAASGRRRGWLTLDEGPNLQPGAALGMIHLLQGSQVEFTFQAGALLNVSPDGRFLAHRLETGRGSMGAPLVNARQRVVGVHLSRGLLPGMPAFEGLENQDAEPRFAVAAAAMAANLRGQSLWPLPGLEA